MGDGNERTGDEAPSRRERSETADGRRNPGDGKGSGGRGEDSLQGRDRHNGDRIHAFVVFERVIMILDGSASVSRRADISQRMQGRMDVFPALQPTVVAVGTALPKGLKRSSQLLFRTRCDL